MYTSIALVALAGVSVAPTDVPAPQWVFDYWQGQERAQQEGRPLAVFIGRGAGGHERIARDGRVSDEVRQLLADRYVPVYVDSSSRAGRELASQFGITQGSGLVISDRSGEVQAFNHDGSLTEADLERNLRRYADPNVVVRTTESNRVSRTSYYPESGGSPQTSYYPQTFAPQPYLSQPTMFRSSFYGGGFGGFRGGFSGGGRGGC